MNFFSLSYKFSRFWRLKLSFKNTLTIQSLCVYSVSIDIYEVYIYMHIEYLQIEY